MEVTLTIENGESELGYVSAAGQGYEAALEAAKALIPEDCRAIVIRVSEQ
ncbi:hypothetical protein [Arthrobacter sp. ISL-95]|nr:hypothetical protein [Arthrobacter sp. ISL-95]MBT2587963.1 hypothetical protein [Arthrobacter sp. ISL-95]